MMTFRQQYDADAKEEAARHSRIDCTGDPIKTEQHHAESLDLNIIAKRYGINDGSIIPQAQDPRHYGDFTEAPRDYREAIDRIRTAEAAFMRLPAKLRAKFNNQPLELASWIQNPENWDEAVNLGLLQKAAEPEAPPSTPPSQT
jgi:phage internal scaffolding protein